MILFAAFTNNVGKAVPQRHLRPWPVPLTVMVYDTFGKDYGNKLYRGIKPHQYPYIALQNVISHGNLVCAVMAKELRRLGWNPAGIAVKAVRINGSGNRDNVSAKQFAQQALTLINGAKTLPNYVGAVSSAGMGLDFSEYVKPRNQWQPEALFWNELHEALMFQLARWPVFAANDNELDGVGYDAIQPETIAVATTSQAGQINHQGVVNQYVDGTFSAVITPRGLDFNGKGRTDYQCTIGNNAAVGYCVDEDCNSFAAPTAFARYLSRLGHALGQFPEKAAECLKHLNPYDFAFPDEATYQQHDSYAKQGYRSKLPSKAVV